MRLLVKLGGALLDDVEIRDRLIGELAGLTRTGHELVVVHGGGKQMTRFLSERGVESKFINGLRVTTPDVLDAVLKVLAGTVNSELVASFRRNGVEAVGLTGIDAGLTEAQPLSPELGAVGKPVGSNPRLLTVLVENGFVPLVACVAGDREGRIYNVNADQMAVACAGAYSAGKLLFLTDVDGVRGADGAVCSELTIRDCERLIREKIATGGMQAKLDSAVSALMAGVEEVRIAPGAAIHSVERLISGDLGTRVRRDHT